MHRPEHDKDVDYVAERKGPTIYVFVQADNGIADGKIPEGARRCCAQDEQRMRPWVAVWVNQDAAKSSSTCRAQQALKFESTALDLLHRRRHGTERLGHQLRCMSPWWWAVKGRRRRSLATCQSTKPRRPAVMQHEKGSELTNRNDDSAWATPALCCGRSECLPVDFHRFCPLRPTAELVADRDELVALENQFGRSFRCEPHGPLHRKRRHTFRDFVSITSPATGSEPAVHAGMSPTGCSRS